MPCGEAPSGERPHAETPNDESREQPRRASVLGWIARSIPALLILAALVGLGYFGHHHGWRLPKFSELIGRREAADTAWCEEHGVPEADCIACKVELMPKGRLFGWCREHGVAECVFEHSELAQLKETPAIFRDDLRRAEIALATRQRSENDPTCKLHLRRIQFASREAADKAGIDIGLVGRGPITETIEANGEVRYDPTRVARLASRAAGTVWRVEKNVGDAVQKGDLLALVDAAAVGQAKAELLQAVAQLNLQDQTLDRLERLGDAIAQRRLQEVEAARQEAEAAVRKALQSLANLGLSITLDDARVSSGRDLAARLHFLGLPPSVSQSLDPQHSTANLIPLTAPRDGVVVGRDVVSGEVIDTTKTLFTVVDNRTMWLVLDVPLEDARYARDGQKVVFRPDGSTEERTGQITWISTRIDAQTRTVQVRAEIPNDDGHLRDESFGGGRIEIREEDNAIVVPKDAIHWEGCCHVAFVRDRDYLAEGSYKVFHTRMVRPGITNGDYTEVIAGLLPGEVIVTKGSDVLRAELLKGNLGAG